MNYSNLFVLVSIAFSAINGQMSDQHMQFAKNVAKSNPTGFTNYVQEVCDKGSSSDETYGALFTDMDHKSIMDMNVHNNCDTLLHMCSENKLRALADASPFNARLLSGDLSTFIGQEHANCYTLNNLTFTCQPELFCMDHVCTKDNTTYTGHMENESCGVANNIDYKDCMPGLVCENNKCMVPVVPIQEWATVVDSTCTNRGAQVLPPNFAIYRKVIEYIVPIGYPGSCMPDDPTQCFEVTSTGNQAP